MSSIRIFFCKKTKKMIFPHFRLVYQCISKCHVLLYKETFSYLTGATHRGKIKQCYVVCCTVFPTSYIHNSVEFHLSHT